jgi:hypothetical protein
MRFGVREVMVIAALTFGVLAVGCRAVPEADPAPEPQAAAAEPTKAQPYRVCFSKYEYEFYGIDPGAARQASNWKAPATKAAAPEKVCARHEDTAVRPGRTAKSWSPVLPSFFK